MSKPQSPFTGLRLSEPATPARQGSDQRLFTPATPAPETTPSQSASQPSTHLPRREDSQEPRKEGTQEAGTPARATRPADERPRFDIGVPATEKNSYMFSEDELWALRDVEAELERTYHTDVSKYNIVRLGLHMLLEDYTKNKGTSFLVRRLRLQRK
jgi:hypothetical protein